MESETLELARPFKRLLAYLVDLLVIYLYIFVLFASSMGVNEIFPFHHLMAKSYVLRHGISFLSLSLPVFLYFFLSEAGPKGATLGKRLMKLKVVPNPFGTISKKDLAIRNMLKFLPWEWAHTFIHLNPDFLTSGQASTPALIVGYIFPVAIMVVFVIMIFFSSKHLAPYERWSNTRVVQLARPNTTAEHSSTGGVAILALVAFMGLISENAAAQSAPQDLAAELSPASPSGLADASFAHLNVSSKPHSSDRIFSAIGIEGGVALQRFVLGGNGEVTFSESNQPGENATRTKGGSGSISMGLAFVRKSWLSVYPSASFGAGGYELKTAHSTTGSARYVSAFLLGEIAINAQFLRPKAPQGGVSLGVALAYRQHFRQSDWKARDVDSHRNGDISFEHAEMNQGHVLIRLKFGWTVGQFR